MINGITAGRIAVAPVGATDDYFNTVALLLHGDSFTDKSRFAVPVTQFGGISLDSSVPLFRGSSFKTTNPGDFLTAALGGALGAGDWTVELFAKPAAGSGFRSLFSTRNNGGDNTGERVNLGLDGSGNAFAYTTGFLLSGAAGTFGTLRHLAMVKFSGIIKIYVDGVAVATSSNNTQFFGSLASALAADLDGSESCAGNFAELRVTGGVARYRANFTPPAASFPEVGTAFPAPDPAGDANFADVVAFLRGETLTDSGPDSRPISVWGSAGLSTAQYRNGASSIVIPGGGSYLMIYQGPLRTFGTGDFTLEAYIRPNGFGSYKSICTSRRNAGGDAAAWGMGTDPGGAPFMYSSGFLVTSSVAVPATAWSHVAFVRESGAMRAYVDGILSGTGSAGNDFTSPILSVGSNGDGSETFDGYIDDLRITQGVARYTANFTPPT